MIAPFASLSCEHFRESRQTRLVQMESSLPSDDVVRHHVQIPQAPDLLAEPFCFAVEPLHFGALERGLVDREDASQAPEADPQLMRPLDIIQLPDHHEIGGDLIEAIAKDVARRLFGDLVRIDRNRSGVLGRQRRFDPPFLGKKIAARRFGEPGKLQASLGEQFVRNVEQSCRAAFEQFDLCFAQFGRASLGTDLSDIDRQFRAGAILERQLACGALDDGLADGQQLGAIHLAKHLFADRQIRDRLQPHPPSRRGALDLADLRQAAMDFVPWS